MSTSGGIQWGKVTFGAGVAMMAVAGLLAAVRDARPPPTSGTPPSVRTTPAALTPTSSSDEAFRAYMGMLAPVVMTAVDAVEPLGDCVETEDTAPASAAGAAECLQQRLAEMRNANAILRAVRPPSDMTDRHAAMLSLSDEAVHALDAYVRAFEAAAPRLDRLRHRRRLQAFYSASDRDEVTALQGVSNNTVTAFSHWADWIHPMNVICNDRLRCMSAGGRADHGVPPDGYVPREPWQNNCPCPRVWNSLRGEGHEAIMTAHESGLPPFRGGIL